MNLEKERQQERASADLPAVSYVTDSGFRDFTDNVTVEEPLEVRIRNESTGEIKIVSVTMRTPGMDQELAAGFLHTEGIITGSSEILEVRHIPDGEGKSGNVIEITVPEEVFSRASGYNRNFTMNSSCGVCGKSSINEVFLKHGKLVSSDMKVKASLLLSLPEKMRAAQEVFSKTGGIHAAGLFDEDGKLIFLAEDIGRHNAVDKIVGNLLLHDALPASESILQVSGRAGFEIVQKAVVAGIPVISSVSAPSSLAVETARAFNSTLVCFVRENRFNIYTHPHRILGP